MDNQTTATTHVVVDRIALVTKFRPAFHCMANLEAGGARLTLSEISAQRLLPIGCWRLVGAHRARPTPIWWQWLGKYDNGTDAKPSHVHLTRDGRRTLCRQTIPTDRDRFNIHHEDAGHAHCVYCRSNAVGGGSRTYDAEGVR